MENLILEPIVFHQATPNAEIGFSARAVGCERAGRYVVAWQEALKAISLRPFHPEACIQMASAAVASGDPQAALPAAQRASDLTPKWQVVQALERTLNAHRKQRKTANPIARPRRKPSPPCSLATILAAISSQPKKWWNLRWGKPNNSLNTLNIEQLISKQSHKCYITVNVFKLIKL